MLKNLRNIEFSKKLLIFIEVLVIMCFCLTAASVIMGDSDPLTALITGVFSLACLAFGFYYWKAKNENIRKYARGLTDTEVNKILKLYDKVFKGGDYDQG